jgi:membrane-associated phospholipid phosphatase
MSSNSRYAMHRGAFFTALASFAAFASLLLIAHLDADDFVSFDSAATHAFTPFQALPWVAWFIAITSVGNSLAIIAVAVGVALLIRHDRLLVARLAFALLATASSVELVKQAIARARPDALAWIGPLHSFSFPSGHAASAMALFGFLAIIAFRLRSRVRRFTALAALGLLILGIGASRIVLAAHYASDVLAGYALGLFWLSLAFLVPAPRGAVD